MFSTKFNEETKLWTGAEIPLVFNPNISIAHTLLRSMKTYGSKVAQISDESGLHFTFAELRMKTIRAAQNLRKLGQKSKQVISVMSDNSDHLSSIIFAAFCLGCPINVLSTQVLESDVVRMFGMTQPTIVFCDVKKFDMIKECLIELGNEAKIITFNGTTSGSEAVENLFEVTGTEETFIPSQVDGINDTAAILCSSGTTGPYKGVCLSHANLISEITAFGMCTSDDVLYSAASMQWISGWNTLLLGILFGATRIITTSSYSPELLLRIIEYYKVTIFMGIPTFLFDILKSGLISKTKLSSIKHIFIRGHKASFSMIQEFNSYLKNGSVDVAYGMTEMSGISAFNLNGSDSEGCVLSGYTFKVINENGNRCQIETKGEICVKPPFKFLGYYNNPKLSASVVDSEGFFQTGDIGYFDKHGDIHLIDRKKDLLNVGFKKIPPSEIEAILTNTNDIKAVCVVGIPCETGTDFPSAVVVKENNSNLSEKDIYKIVADNKADLKLKGGVYFVESIPTTPSGKFLRRWAKEFAIKQFTEKGGNPIEL